MGVSQSYASAFNVDLYKTVTHLIWLCSAVGKILVPIIMHSLVALHNLGHSSYGHCDVSNIIIKTSSVLHFLFLHARFSDMG